MPILTIWISPPESWEEFVVSTDKGISHRLAVTGKLAPFRTKVEPEEPGWDVISVDLVSSGEQQIAYAGVSRHDGAYAGVPVDVPTLAWVKEQWAKGRQIELSLHGEDVTGFGMGWSPDGDDVVWNQKQATYVKFTQAVLSASAYKDGTEMQAAEAPIPQAPIHPDLKTKLTKIATRLDWLVGIAAMFAVYYWLHR